jgi:hypothetical protein
MSIAELVKEVRNLPDKEQTQFLEEMHQLKTERATERAIAQSFLHVEAIANPMIEITEEGYNDIMQFLKEAQAAQ